jgi:hypothetical protein
MERPLDYLPRPQTDNQGAQLSQDIKKTQSMLSQTNQQLTEYVEKYTRQVSLPFSNRLATIIQWHVFPTQFVAPSAHDAVLLRRV